MLMGEDSNKMGFCEAKMSFCHTNEAGLTGLEVSSKDSKPKGTMDLPMLHRRSHLLHVLTGVGAHRIPRILLLPYLPFTFPSTHGKAGHSRRDGR